MNSATGRKRAQRAYPKTPCQECGQSQGRIDRHHVNGNTMDNSPTNIAMLCAPCHARRHWIEGSQSQRVAAQRANLDRIGEAVRTDYNQGMPVAEVMKKYGIATSTLYRLVKPARM